MRFTHIYLTYNSYLETQEKIKAEYFITETVVVYRTICTLRLAKPVAEKFGFTFVHSLTQNLLQDDHVSKTDNLSYSLSFFSSFLSLYIIRQTPVFYRHLMLVGMVLVRADCTCTSDDVSSIGVVRANAS